jgi:hypothetical protein
VSNQFGLNGHNMLYINNGKLGFIEQSEGYGLNFSGLSTQAAFFDYDHDGDLDCYLLNHSKKPHSNVVDTSNRRKYDPVFGDKMYRNELSAGQQKFTDVSAQAGIYQSSLGYGLGLAVADFNNDGWEDIYVGNDFHENDYYYLNNHNGTFREAGAQHFKHYSRFSMGNDAADFNNDGQMDMLTLDMLPPDEKTLKTYGSDENPNMYKMKLAMNGYQNQYSRNCLQRNNGNGVSYSDMALMANVSATDWSWCPLFADFDNDGVKDLFVSSGIVKRPVDLDYIQFVSAMQQNKGLDKTDKFDEETIAKMPDGSSHPFFFKGNGQQGFGDVSAEWGTEKLKGYSNGSAYADLDNDGRLDMVINCIDAPAIILKNNTPSSSHITVSMQGDSLNTKGIGAKVWAFAKGRMQYQQLMPTRGFQSASEPRLHFGLDSAAMLDSLLVVWPNHHFQWLKNIPANKPITLKAREASGIFNYEQWFPQLAPLLQDVTVSSGINWRHQENEYVDFNRQYLIPHAQSTRGPKVAVADVNNDGLQDFYVCGARGQMGALMLQTAGGKFVPAATTAFAPNARCEEVAAVFADINGDAKPDLYVVSGGNEWDDGAAELADHLYLNMGGGNFSEATGAIPSLLANKSCVAAADADKDGDIDLFVGGLANAAAYGLPQSSYLLLNNGKGVFERAPESIINLTKIGLVTAAAFADIDGDNLPELLVTGEWMPLRIYKSNNGKFTASEVPNSTGLWQTLQVADVNNDNKPDVLAGNWGHNTKLHAGKNGPVKLYVKDFDKNGTTEQIMAYTINGKEYTFLAKDELERALPVLKKAYLTYSEVAGQTVQYMFYDLFKDFLEQKAETLSSSVFMNKGNGQFDMVPLPSELQMAPLFSFSNKSAENWMLAGGNFYGTVPYEGRYDAMLPTVFAFHLPNKNLNIVGSLPAINGEVRDAQWITVNGKSALLLARNNAPLLLLQKIVNNK